MTIKTTTKIQSTCVAVRGSTQDPHIWAIAKEWEGVLILQHRQNTYLPQIFAHAAPGDVGQGGDGDVVVVLVPRHFGETAAGREEVEGD